MEPPRARAVQIPRRIAAYEPADKGHQNRHGDADRIQPQQRHVPRSRVGDGPLPLRDLQATHPLIVPTRETGLRAAFDALAARLRVTPIYAAEVDDMAMIRLLARADAGLAIIPPIVVRDEFSAETLVEASRLDGIGETFFAVTRERRFPNPLLADVLPV